MTGIQLTRPEIPDHSERYSDDHATKFHRQVSLLIVMLRSLQLQYHTYLTTSGTNKLVISFFLSYLAYVVDHHDRLLSHS